MEARQRFMRAALEIRSMPSAGRRRPGAASTTEIERLVLAGRR